MTALLLDSSSSNLTVALSVDNKIIHEVEYEAWQRQSELLTYEINLAFQKTKLTAQDLTAVVVSVGPGSYTGVRIAVSVAKTFSYALNIPLYKTSSLKAMRVPGQITIAVLDARSGRSYVGVYKDDETLLEDTILTNEETLNLVNKYENAVFAGELKHLELESASFNRALNLLSELEDTNKVTDVKKLKPVYLKEQYGQK